MGKGSGHRIERSVRKPAMARGCARAARGPGPQENRVWCVRPRGGETRQTIAHRGAREGAVRRRTSGRRGEGNPSADEFSSAHSLRRRLPSRDAFASHGQLAPAPAPHGVRGGGARVGDRRRGGGGRRARGQLGLRPRRNERRALPLPRAPRGRDRARPEPLRPAPLHGHAPLPRDRHRRARAWRRVRALARFDWEGPRCVRPPPISRRARTPAASG